MTIYFSNITFIFFLFFFLKPTKKSKFIHLFSHLWRIPETLHWYKLSSYENCFAWQFFPLFQPTVWTWTLIGYDSKSTCPTWWTSSGVIPNWLLWFWKEWSRKLWWYFRCPKGKRESIELGLAMSNQVCKREKKEQRHYKLFISKKSLIHTDVKEIIPISK